MPSLLVSLYVDPDNTWYQSCKPRIPWHEKFADYLITHLVNIQIAYTLTPRILSYKIEGIEEEGARTLSPYKRNFSSFSIKKDKFRDGSIVSVSYLNNPTYSHVQFYCVSFNTLDFFE
jgi:hypothetical protein